MLLVSLHLGNESELLLDLITLISGCDFQPEVFITKGIARELCKRIKDFYSNNLSDKDRIQNT